MRTRVFAIAPAVILAGVASLQIYLAHAHDLTPWKGGGFGMFATTDAGPARRLRVVMLRGGMESEVALDETLSEPAARARAFPTRRALREIGERVAARLGRESGVYSALRVELWRIRFDPGDLRPDWTLLRSVEVPPRVDAS